MVFISTKNIEKEKLYYCYSPPLTKWLQEIKNIYPIRHDTYKKPGKFFGNEFDVYILNDLLNDCLVQWTNNKYRNKGCDSNGQN